MKKETLKVKHIIPTLYKLKETNINKKPLLSLFRAEAGNRSPFESIIIPVISHEITLKSRHHRQSPRKASDYSQLNGKIRFPDRKCIAFSHG